MELVDGVILRGAPPADVRFDVEVAAQLSQEFVQQLVALHTLDVASLGLGAFGYPDGYVMRQVLGWRKRWQAAQTGVVPNIDAIADWLSANAPAERGAVLIHNDFKYDNLVLDPDDLTHVRTILDWEMATIGCPLMDLGTSLAYWVESGDPPLLRSLGLGVTAMPGSFSRRELVVAYSRASGMDVIHPVFYYAFGLFKLAVVAQQIFARHVAGLTSDPRFAQLDQAVAMLGTCAAEAVSRDAIGR
jgi:aminoglycoside phosphotransferase (APT) family kinase protein